MMINDEVFFFFWGEGGTRKMKLKKVVRKGMEKVLKKSIAKKKKKE